jgi:hypothetical protein
MNKYPPISQRLHEKLMEIVPSRDGEMEYRPCSVTLRDGIQLPCVYVVPVQPYGRYWGIPREQERGKPFVRVEDIVDITESPLRLPAQFASHIYEGGESGMGYCLFTVVFGDGLAQSCGTGNAVDFVALPDGYTGSDIVRVERHAGRNAPRMKRSLEFFWCFYDGVQPDVA